MPLFELLKLISITTHLLDGIKNREFLEISRPLQGLSIRQKVLDLLHDVAVKLFRALQHLFILKNFLWVDFFVHVFVHPLLWFVRCLNIGWNQGFELSENWSVTCINDNVSMPFQIMDYIFAKAFYHYFWPTGIFTRIQSLRKFL